MTDFPKLDREDILERIFHPRSVKRNDAPDDSWDIDCKIDDDVVIGCRFHSCSKESPTIIYFHGNGETVADYDEVCSQYVKFGMNILVVSYRGYGWSTGSPSVSHMYSDAGVVFTQGIQWLGENDFNGPVFLMGRSLGSTCAIALAAEHKERIKGLIIESGFSDSLPLLQNLGVDTLQHGLTEEDCFQNCERIAKVTLPTIILHGYRDEIIPVQLAEKLQACSGAKAKQFLAIPGADHNSTIAVGGPRYFETIKSFIDKTCGITKWQYRRRKYTKPGR